MLCSEVCDCLMPWLLALVSPKALFLTVFILNDIDTFKCVYFMLYWFKKSLSVCVYANKCVRVVSVHVVNGQNVCMSMRAY